MESVDTIMYARYILRVKNGKKILHVKLKKALYGCLQSALLFYQKLRGELKACGFFVNP